MDNRCQLSTVLATGGTAALGAVARGLFVAVVAAGGSVGGGRASKDRCGRRAGLGKARAACG
jgi:hypothetical protein